MPNWLVTGGSGFLGRHLLAELASKRPSDVSVVTIGRRRPEGTPTESFLPVDLEDRAGLGRVLDLVRPSVVFHLAGKTPPGSPEEFERLNATVTAGMIGGLSSLKTPCRFLHVGSAAELGPVSTEDLPVGESYVCRPIDPYGRSKLRATQIVLAAAPPIEPVIARVFNPIGPALPTSQALGRFAFHLAGGMGPIRLVVGNLEARRDFVDVRDVAAGLLKLSLRGQPGEVYHLGTGLSHSVREGLERLIALSGREVTIEVDPALVGSPGPSDSRADLRKMAEATGWSAQISWERSLGDLWTEARARSGLTDLGASV